jgi:oligoribonuclease NrnB/cAMP/cGMP phosphodiesterase (DHH superfamily)
MNVWEYINTVGDEERTTPREPFAPKIHNYLITPDGSTIKILSDQSRYVYNHNINQYKKELTYYWQFMRGIGAIMMLINQTTGLTAKLFIQDMDMSTDV